MSCSTRTYLIVLFSGVLSLTFVSCSKYSGTRAQGFIEGRLTLVSSPKGGKLEQLTVARGDMVQKDELLYVLEDEPELFQLEGATAKFQEVDARLRDLEKGSRPSELDSLEAQITEIQYQLEEAELQLARRRELLKSKFIDQESVDKAARDVDVLRAKQTRLRSDLVTAKLGGREDAIIAAGFAKESTRSDQKLNEWYISQKRGFAPGKAMVFDTFYRLGEYVAAARPVVALLDPGEIKAIFYIPETVLSTVLIGNAVSVYLDGEGEAVKGKISYISPNAEFTPPVIYSNETRSKLVFKVEASFDEEVSQKLHPGQPVEVEF